MSAAGVLTRRKRFTLVEKTAGQVGDGTEWPLEVPLHQLAEILYRVKDAVFTAGTISFDLFGETATVSIENPPSSSSPRVSSEIVSGDIMISARGYFAESSAIAAPFSGYFEAAYIPSYSAPEVQDIGDNERGIWVPPEEVAWGTQGLEGQAFGDPVAWGTAFAHYLYSYGLTDTFSSNYGLYDNDNAASTPSLRLSTELELAWVGTDFFDAATKYYLKVKFQFYLASDEVFTSIDTGTSAGNLNFVLSGGTLTIPLYLATFGTSITAAITTDFTITAREWWPYARNTDPPAIWDAGSGEKLPDVADLVFAAFDFDMTDQLLTIL